ncbi:MAG: L-glutamate gamma-semialdehyde dehydrogenase [Chloroflexota bacterium]|nr:L-glutamate gamma-semialdehyde dehydrogenase [Chloroflexota bacterium]
MSETSYLPIAAAAEFRPPEAVNEPTKNYAPGSPERQSLTQKLRELSGQRMEIPLIIGGEAVRTGTTKQSVMPHRHAHVLADVHQGGASEVTAAIHAASEAWTTWSRWAWWERAAVFLRAADLLSGPWRDTINAATMLGQSKTAHQAEIDAAAELIDFWRFNVSYIPRIYAEQPLSSAGVWNRLEYRPLEGFVFAVTPFNFTSIAGNLPSSVAMMGNTVVWKPASTAMYVAHFLMELFRAAGLPDGVINLVYGSGGTVGDAALDHPDLAGVHFTGSTPVFQQMWRDIGTNIGGYRNYPRVVGETGGKNFIIAHPSADIPALTTAIARGAFEYQGQKCSAASRVFVAESLWPTLRDQLGAEISTIKMGDITDYGNFMGAVIDRNAWETHRTAIALAQADPRTEVVIGGKTDDSEGYFVEPTVILTENLDFPLLHDELFGPIVTVYVYPDGEYSEMLRAIDRMSKYGLTGSVFARDRAAIAEAEAVLRHAAGNFYINDKPTGAVVGQQPFGGARASGTNDKAGSMWNLIRWVSPRAVKETFVPATDYRYPFLQSE